MATFTIRYWIPFPVNDENDFTPFQGFSSPLLVRDRFFHLALRWLPPTILELYGLSVAALQQRVAGTTRFNVQPIMATELASLAPSARDPFWVFFVDPETADAISAWKQTISHPVLVLDPSHRSTNTKKKATLELQQHCMAVATHLNDASLKSLLLTLKEKRRKNGRNPLSIPIATYSHNTTLPNELPLINIGFKDNARHNPLVGADDRYVSAIVGTADELAKLRGTIPDTELFETYPRKSEIVLATPGLFKHFRSYRRSKGTPNSLGYKLLRCLQSQSSYSMQIATELLTATIEDPECRHILEVRTGEQNVFTSAMALRSTSSFSPVFRLSPAFDQLLPSVIRVSDAARANEPDVRKVCVQANQLFEGMSKILDARILERIDLPHSHAKIVSDAPLEWLPVRGLPLMFRTTTSRIPSTPGNLAFTQIAPPEQLTLPLEAFSETLVIRSFRDGDPLRMDLENATHAFRLTSGAPVPARFVDVATKSDLIAALNSFRGALAIFDCHGIHRDEESIGKLQLSGEDVSIWDIREDARMPPIVFTCVCDTHSLARNHVTCANGFLFCGARALVSSLLPVEAKRAAIYAARLLFRIYELLPALGKSFRSVRWDWVVGLLQRMMFMTELLAALELRFSIPADTSRLLMIKGVTLIHSHGPSWYEELVGEVVTATSVSHEDVEALRRDTLALPEAMKFIQMGNPESILIAVGAK